MSKPTLPELVVLLERLVKWQMFALFLPGIKQSEIEIVEMNKRDDVKGQKVALYETWLRVYPDASWEDVISALEAVGENTIAAELRMEFNIQQSEEAASEKSKASPMSPSQSLADPHVPEGVVAIADPHVPEDVVAELEELQKSFRGLTNDVRSQVEIQVENGSVTIKSLVDHIQEERAFHIKLLESVKTPENFFKAIFPHYNFLNCHLIIILALFLSNTGPLAEKAKIYHEKIQGFKKSTAVANLQNILKQHYRDFRACNRNIVEITVENPWGPLSIWLVEVLVQTLFPVKHSAELQWFEVVPGSVIIPFLVLEHMVKPLIESSKKKLEFMRLIGVISLRIGDESVKKGEENKLFTFNNSLIEATLIDNIEVVQFLLQYIPVDVNVKNTAVSLIGDADRDQLYHTEPNVAVCLEIRLATYKKLKYAEDELQQKESDSNKFEHHFSNNFLNARILADQSLQLSESLLQRVNQYSDIIEFDKKQALITHWIKPLEKYFPDPFPSSVQVIISLHSVWSSCSVWFIEQIVQLISPSLYNEFQWFRVKNTADCLQIVLLVPNSLAMGVIVQSVGMQQVTELLGVIRLKVDKLIVIVNNIKDYCFNTAISQARRLGTNEVLDILVQVIQTPVDTITIITVDVNSNCRFIPDPDSTPLMIACCNDNIQLVKLLLDHNADPNIVNRRKITALMYSSGNSEIYQMLLDSGADINKEECDGSTTMHHACAGGNIQVVGILLARKHDLLYRVNRYGQTPLKLASMYGHLAIVKRLLQEQADPNIQDIGGRTPLMSASSIGHIAIVKQLLQEQADPNIQDIGGWTPLMSASSTGHIAIVERLLQKQADPNIQNNEGQTPLMLACSNGHIGIVKRLLQEQVDPNIQDNEGWTPLKSASFKGHLAIVERLLQEQVDPNIQDNEGWTPLMSASSKGHLAIVERLLLEHADPNIHDNKGRTPLKLANYHGHLEIVQRLLQEC